MANDGIGYLARQTKYPRTTSMKRSYRVSMRSSMQKGWTSGNVVYKSNMDEDYDLMVFSGPGAE
jgi:hypothetical protein